jgi:hypothetical protein
VPQRVIYLDQNKWIELAQAVHGKGQPRLSTIVDFVRVLKESGAAVFPLSLAHHIETAKRFDAGQHERLGRFMWEISDTLRFASPTTILRSEIDLALARTFQRPLKVRPFTLVRPGLDHALGRTGMGFTIEDPDRVLPASTKAELEQFANRMLDYAVLTGTTPWGAAPRPRPDLSGPSKGFVASIVELRTKLTAAPPDLRRRTVYARILVDMLSELVAALYLHGLSIEQFAALGLNDGHEAYIRFLELMPSVRVNAHLYFQWLQNPALPVRENDLNDWHFVGTAAAYADVVVTERHLAHVLNLGSLEKKATVITDLVGLPAA